ncbi:putative RNA-directed DNA polymerase from transposon X-element [Araneus ventricosus]|uniref:Putative RNA-directed DNA polymerase from transposon X-element n=1 Tax=Araneus ventricosus TaxID=182803 RepID=A0A4Y2A728_ARAVE|nr:putative RNA-directed DNA polymerase from transposon X-element [Araneus ventricosus]
MPSSPNHYQYLMGSLSLVVEANSSTRYMLINTPNTFHTVSPFLVQKLLTSCIAEIQNVKKLRSGDLLVQVDSKQASVISKLTHLGTFPVETSFHKTLNVSRGVLSNPDFIHVTEAEFLEELRDQNVCAARRINIRRDGRLIPTQHVVLTFQTPVLPKSIKAGYINCKLGPYIPNPLRCFKCQRYGHSQQSCRGTDPVCGKCAESGHETNVCPSDTFKCRNCSGLHAASSKSCPTWIFEKEVIAVKIKRNITFPEARQIVKDRTPTVGVFYSSTVQMQPKIRNNTSEISSMQLPVSIPLSTLPSKFFTAPTTTTSMKNNSPKKSKQPTPSTSKTDIVKSKKKLKPLENSSKKTLDAKHFLKSNTSSESDMELDSSSAYRNVTKVHPVCIALQETYLKPADIAKIKRYSLVRKDNENESGRASGGVALLVSHDTPSSVITLHTNLQAVAVRVMFSNLVTICTLYLPPSTSVDERDLNRLVDELPTPFIILGDFNGNSPLWGSKNTNLRGRQIEEFVNTHSLCLLNNGEDTYFHQRSRTFHSLDLALCTPSLAPYFNFRVGVDLRDSDHFPIFLDRVNVGSNDAQRPTRYLFHRADWTHFALRALITRDMVEGENLNEVVNLVTKTIISAADDSIPKSGLSFPKNRKPWWNKYCTDTNRDQRRAWNVFRRHPTSANQIAFQRAKSVARWARRKSERGYWIKFVSGINSSVTAKDMWDNVRRACGIYPEKRISCLRKNGQEVRNISDMGDVLAEAFASICSASNYTEPFLTHKNRTERIKLRFQTTKRISYNADLTIFELHTSLSVLKHTSPGPDEVTYSMLQHLSEHSLQNILYMFNRIWKEHVFPDCWKHAFIIPIPKPGKDPQDPLNYRPIALTSCMCKLFERIVNVRLVHILEKNEYISPFQSGFRKSRSTIDNLMSLETDIRVAFLKRNHLVSIFFDIYKAYDRTWRYGIMKNLYDLGFRGNLPIFVQNFLKQRFFRVRMGNTYSNIFCQEEGVPQGSVLSVTLFVLAINPILSVIPQTVQKNLYVDDLHISCYGRNMQLIERQLQIAINNIVEWSNKSGFTISAQKTIGIHFCKRPLHADPELLLSGVPIRFQDNYKFLGIYVSYWQQRALELQSYSQDFRRPNWVRCLKATLGL